MPMTSVRVVTSWRTSPRPIVGYGTTGRSISAQATAACSNDRPDTGGDDHGPECPASVQDNRDAGTNVRDETDPAEHRREGVQPEREEPRGDAADEATGRRKHEPDDGERFGQRHRDEVAQR